MCDCLMMVLATSHGRVEHDAMSRSAAAGERPVQLGVC